MQESLSAVNANGDGNEKCMASTSRLGDDWHNLATAGAESERGGERGESRRAGHRARIREGLFLGEHLDVKGPSRHHIL